jgi:hypothetical protein
MICEGGRQEQNWLANRRHPSSVGEAARLIRAVARACRYHVPRVSVVVSVCSGRWRQASEGFRAGCAICE